MPAIPNLLTAAAPLHSKEGYFTTTKAAFLRPNDATAYTSGDTIGDDAASANYLVFPGVGRNGSVHNGILIYGKTATAAFDLLLFDAVPVGGMDNAALALTNLLVANLIGVLRFLDGHKVNLGTNVEMYRAVGPQNELANGPLGYSTLTNTLYGMLVTRSAFTPAAQDSFSIQLTVKTR